MSFFCPRPEYHRDSGKVESVITAARRRIAAGMDEAETHADLVSLGVASDEAHLAIVAAKLLGVP